MPRWLKITVLASLIVGNLAVLAAIWALRTGEDALATADTDPEVAAVLDIAAGDSLTFLIVGSDSREGLDDLTNFGRVGGSRGDVIMLVRLDSGESRAQILSIPRDTWVAIPESGENKINAAYAIGGSSLMVRTIQENFKVEINHYVEIDFVGFIALVDQLGGVEIAFPYPARDLKSGLDVPAGELVLDGKTALAYARSRTYEELRDGSWVKVDANDIGRTRRQQEVIRAILRRLKRPSTITEAGEVANTLAQYVTIDSALGSTSVASLVWDFKGILTGDVEGATLPTATRSINGASVQVLAQPEATTMLANFRAGVPMAEQPLRVEVLNGNGIGGSAQRMSQTLTSLGFQVEGIGNASTKDYAVTTVVVPPGSDAGERIVEALGFGEVATGTVDNGYDAVVIVGADSP
ncbi:MAG: LCP family protein [Acidimicrobiia bacterium]